MSHRRLVLGLLAAASISVAGCGGTTKAPAGAGSATTLATTFAKPVDADQAASQICTLWKQLVGPQFTQDVKNGPAGDVEEPPGWAIIQSDGALIPTFKAVSAPVLSISTSVDGMEQGSALTSAAIDNLTTACINAGF
jgi:hypothetical protein